MEQKYLDLLPGELRTIVQRVEAAAGCTIEVKPDESSQPFSYIDMGIDLQSGQCDATIYYVGAVTRFTLIHEVLHLSRNWLDEVPRLMAVPDAPDGFKREVEVIENDLEHLWVVQEEQKYVKQDSDNHWESVYQRTLADVGYLNKRALLQSLPRHWMVLSLALPHLRSMQSLQEVLRHAGLMTTARTFVHNLRKSLPDKRRCIALAVDSLEIPRRGLQIERYNVAARRTELEKIPI